MHRANRGVLTEVQLLSHAHQLQPCSSIQMAQKAIIGLVGYSWEAICTRSPIPLDRLLSALSKVFRAGPKCCVVYVKMDTRTGVVGYDRFDSA